MENYNLCYVMHCLVRKGLQACPLAGLSNKILSLSQKKAVNSTYVLHRFFYKQNAKKSPQPSSISYAYFVLGFRKMKIGNSGAVCGLPQIVVTILLLQKKSLALLNPI